MASGRPDRSDGRLGRSAESRVVIGHQYDWIDRGREISCSVLGFGRVDNLVERRMRDDDSRFGRGGRARHLVVGLKWVNHGRMLPGSVCALGRALCGSDVVLCAGRSRDHSSSVDRCARSWALLRGFSRLNQSSLNRS
ncbi:unnamed protein product [Microthlaspi erraticum]|uniref:Uncharacterized protein n=1 Tax=Microthlaspi erraticum TaxID=1685480 RepID=A0A6D2ITE2_9BRAS|nr:unnamed protein product [Microthlaspi erraticum]